MSRKPKPREGNPDDWALVDNAADPRQVGDAKRVERDREEQDKLDFREVSGTPAGQRLLWRFLERGSMFMPTWHENPAVMSLNEGRRDMALWVMAKWLEANPDSYVAQMIARRKERK